MSDAVFNAYYKRLNKEQKLAVDTIEGPVMVIAGPGTGKTTILTLRIANILRETDTPPSGILAITYTDAGVKAMRMKLREIIGSRADEVRIHTFHSFAASVIAEFDDHFPHLAKSKQLSDIESEALIRSIIKDKKFTSLRPVGEPEFYVQKIIRAISDAKKEAWTPDMVREFAGSEMKRIENDESSISTRGATKGKLKADALKHIEKCEKTILFADAYEKYEQKKKETKRMDYDDLIIELLLALRKDELLLRMIQEKFLYIHVDEHQDTNDSQNQLIRTIANFFEEPNLFVVGDEKQAIYRFQGASVKNFLGFQDTLKSMQTISLKSNYRSHQHILDSGFSLIEHNYAEGEHKNLRVKLISGSQEQPKPIDVVTAGNNKAAELYLVEELKKLIKTKPDKSVAIIVRRNRDVERIIALLEERAIPATSERGADIFAHPVGTLFFDLIRCVADPSQIESLAKTLALGLWGLSFEQSSELIKKIRSGTAEDISEKIPAIDIIRNELSKSGAVAFLIKVAELSGFSALVARNSLSVEVWRAIVALAEDIARRNELEDPLQLISELLAYQLSAESKSIKIAVGAPDSQIRIMTAHGSKGLEYDCVFMPYAVEEAWGIKARGSYFVFPGEKDEEDDIRDARRLFYVALTRARSHVAIICGLEEEGGRALTPLRFIDEIDLGFVSKVSVSAAPYEMQRNSGKNIAEKQNKDLVEYAKNVLLEKGLSVTALNHFATCPSQFFYKSILKLPEAPNASSEKGNAMHEAIAEVWKLAKKDEKSIATTLKSAVQAYFKTSLLPIFEKEVVLEELIESAPIVATALKEHFNMEGAVSAETWMETVFKGEYGKKSVSLNLHGKLDAVVDTDNTVFVFDYKTTKAMSPASIKGETQSSDGNYFRQLVFYKILLESNYRFKNKTIEPSLVFVKPDDKGRCPIVTLPVEKADIEKVKGEVQALIESVWSGKVLTDTCGDSECEYCKLRGLHII